MSIDFERGLRAEMERAPIAPRPGVVREAYLRSRKRQRTTRAGIAAGTAVLSAAAAVGVVTTGTAPPAVSGATATATLMDHMTSALAKTGDVLEVHTAPFNRSTTTAWYYGTSQRVLVIDVSGKPVWDAEFTHDANRDGIATYVNYGPRTAEVNRTWSGRMLPGHVTCDMAGNQPISDTLLNSPGRSRPAAMAAAMRTLLGCGTTQITAHQRFRGIEATKIAYSDPRYPKIHQTLWVDESTYLPVAGVFTLLAGEFKGDFTTSFTWLPPTDANQARLSAPIPAGFKVTRDTGSSVALPFPWPLFGAPCPAEECTPKPAVTPSASGTR